MILNSQKSSKIKGLFVDWFHCREPYNQFFETLYMPSNPYFIRFSNFTLYHISSLFCTESEDFGTKLVQNWYKIGTKNSYSNSINILLAYSTAIIQPVNSYPQTIAVADEKYLNHFSIPPEAL